MVLLVKFSPTNDWYDLTLLIMVPSRKNSLDRFKSKLDSSIFSETSFIRIRVLLLLFFLLSPTLVHLVCASI